MKVFILEDDPTRMLYLREKLTGHDITHIESCTQADRFQPPYDLILLDHDLGGRQLEDHEDDGLAFVTLVKDRVPRDAVIVIHSYNDAGARRMAYALREVAGYGNLYVAGFRFKEFNIVLDAVLEHHRGKEAA